MLKKYWGYYLVILVMLLTLSVSHQKSQKLRNNEENLFYYQLNDVITSISTNRGTIFLTLKNFKKGRINFGFSYNSYVTPSDFHEFVRVGDTICKPANSWDLFVIRKKVPYYFEIGKNISFSKLPYDCVSK